MHRSKSPLVRILTEMLILVAARKSQMLHQFLRQIGKH